jgi:hypothetical protein
MTRQRAPLRAATMLGLAAMLAACASCGPPGGSPGEGRGPAGGERGGAPSELGGGPRGAGSPAAARQMFFDQSATQLALARARLNLSTPQEPAWNAYADAIGALLADLSRESPQPAGGNAVHRIDRRVDVARNRYAALENVADAMRALYSQLDDGQKRMADRVLPGTVPSLAAGALLPADSGDAAGRPGGTPGGRSQRPERRY